MCSQTATVPRPVNMRAITDSGSCEDIQPSLNMLTKALQKDGLCIASALLCLTQQHTHTQAQQVITTVVPTHPSRASKNPEQHTQSTKSPQLQHRMCKYTLILYTCAHISRKGISWCPTSITQFGFGLCPKAQSNTIEVRYEEECDDCLIRKSMVEKRDELERRRDEGTQ
jgi:hypothetical protein